MTSPEANINIQRSNDGKTSVNVIMPMWAKSNIDDTISISLPFFRIKTFARNEEQIDSAIKEAITCFCISADKFGKGLEAELEAMGWTSVDFDGQHSLGFFIEDDSLIEDIVQTGKTFSDKLAIA